jgi:excisionase family DNA binding protein
MAPDYLGKLLLTVDEVADLLRTTRLAIYSMHARAEIPGAVKINRRLLFRTKNLLEWLHQEPRGSSPKEWRR